MRLRRLMRQEVPDIGQDSALVGTDEVPGVTGALPSMTREQATALITTNGGKVTGSVTKKTSYLLTGAEPSRTKYNKALELGVPLLDEAGLLGLVGGEGAPAGGEIEGAQEAGGGGGQVALDL